MLHVDSSRRQVLDTWFTVRCSTSARVPVLSKHDPTTQLGSRRSRQVSQSDTRFWFHSKFTTVFSMQQNSLSCCLKHEHYSFSLLSGSVDSLFQAGPTWCAIVKCSETHQYLQNNLEERRVNGSQIVLLSELILRDTLIMPSSAREASQFSCDFQLVSRLWMSEGRKKMFHPIIVSWSTSSQSTAMMKILHFLLSVLPLVNGSSLLKYVPDSAYCTGNLADLEWVSASCPNNDFGCTWGSKALLFVQCKKLSGDSMRLFCASDLTNITIT